MPAAGVKIYPNQTPTRSNVQCLGGPKIQEQFVDP